MRKFNYMFILVTFEIIVNTLIGSAPNAPEKGITSSKNTLYFQMSEKFFADQNFLSAVDNNYIDAKFSFSDGSTEEIIRLYSDYATAWTEEMNRTMLVLEEILDEEDFNLLISAQRGWQNYLDNSVSFNRTLYYIGSKYNTADSNTYRDVSVERAQKIRDRTIDLWSYMYTLTGSTDFITDECLAQY